MCFHSNFALSGNIGSINELKTTVTELFPHAVESGGREVSAAALCGEVEVAGY